MREILKEFRSFWFVFGAILCSGSATADYAGALTPKHMYGAGSIKFGADSQPPGTCVYYNRIFKFDATSEAGKNMFAILLSAVASGKKVDVWYTPSDNPGTTQANGCSESNLATVTQLGLS